MKGVMLDQESAARLRRRYPPPRVSRRLTATLVAAGAAVAMVWLIWAALSHARPAVAAQVTSYEAFDTSMKVTFTVDRPDPGRPVSCRVAAQAANHETVGEQNVPVAAGPFRLVDVSVEIRTVRRAVAATVGGCLLN
jgi:hypothetical protein